MTPNPGHLPEDCIVRDDEGTVTGYRNVRVRLRVDDSDKPARERPTWPSAGVRPATRWTLTDHPFDIVAYEVV